MEVLKKNCLTCKKVFFKDWRVCRKTWEEQTKFCSRNCMGVGMRDFRNVNWKEKNVGYESLHTWVKRRKPKTELCESCKELPPRDLANISSDYLRDLSDWEWLCRRCHMIKDGRMKNLKQYQIKNNIGKAISV